MLNLVNKTNIFLKKIFFFLFNIKTSGFIQGLHNQEALDQKLSWFPCFCAQYEDLVVSFLLMKKKICDPTS